MKNRLKNILVFIVFAMVVLISVMTFPIWVILFIVTGINAPENILLDILEWGDIG